MSLAQPRIQDAAYAPGQGTAQRLARFARREHLSTGYAGYWDASALTWQLHDPRVAVYPLITCGSSCARTPYHKINTWYLPRPLARSFFMVMRGCCVYGLMGRSAVPRRRGGRRGGVVHLGPLTIYVYSYNLAAKLLPSA